jgi:hypothetical protein
LTVAVVFERDGAAVAMESPHLLLRLCCAKQFSFSAFSAMARLSEPALNAKNQSTGDTGHYAAAMRVGDTHLRIFGKPHLPE